jgi:hypothetical protein
VSAPASHELDIYGVIVHCAFDRRAWSTLRRRMKGALGTPDSMGRTEPVEQEVPGKRARDHVAIFIDVGRARDAADIIDTMAHEAYHATTSILHDRMAAPSIEHDEAQAYLCGWITGWLWKSLPVEYHDRVRPPQRAAGK